MGNIPAFYTIATSIDLANTSEIFCKIRSYVNQGCSMYCRWILVMACIDRYLVSSNNAKYRRSSSVTIARWISLVNFIVWSIFPMYQFFFLVILEPLRNNCGFNNLIVNWYHGIYTLCVGGILPAVFMLVCGWLLKKNLSQRKTRRGNNQSSGPNSNRDDQILLILTVQVVIYLLTNLPFTIHNLYMAVTRGVTNKSVERIAIEIFTQNITRMLVDNFPGTLFYTSTLTSPTFRAELFKLIKLMLRCNIRRDNRTNPSSNLES